MTTPDIQQAREWAESRANGNYILSEKTQAAVRVIQSLPDQWIDEEKVRRALEGCDEMTYAYEVIEHIERTLLTPSLPTLEDMPPEERKACLWMQARIHRSEDQEGVIFSLTDYRVKVMFRDGTFVTQDHDEVTPLPDLPKLKWPGDGVEDLACREKQLRNPD